MLVNNYLLLLWLETCSPQIRSTESTLTPRAITQFDETSPLWGAYSPALSGHFHPFCSHRLDTPPGHLPGRGVSGALAAWAAAGFPYGKLGPLKISINFNVHELDIEVRQPRLEVDDVGGCLSIVSTIFCTADFHFRCTEGMNP